MKAQKTMADFTPGIQAKIPQYIEKYTKGVFDGGRYNAFTKENAQVLINHNYAFCGYKKPVMLVAENPYEAQVFFNYIKSNQEIFLPIIYINWCLLNGVELPKELSDINLKKNSQLHSQLRSQLELQLRSQLESQLRSQLESQLHSQLESQLHSQLYSQLDSQLHSQLHSQLENKYNPDYLFSVSSYGGSYFSWYKFIKDEFNLKSEVGVNLDSFNDLHQNGNVYSAIFSKLLCVVSKYPKKINRNANNDLHSIEGSCIEWGNLTDLTKWENHFINGRNIPEKHFRSISEKTFTMEDFANEKNEEYKSTCIAFMQAKWGDEYLVNFFRENLKEVDSFVDKKNDVYLTGTTKGMNIGVYTLFNGNINGEDIAYVRCYCPSTDRMFFLGVDSSHTSARDAIASLYRFPVKLIPYIKSISRQGERFSTILTDKGKDILKSLPQDEIENVSGISGSDYFRLMKYEF